MTPSAVQDLRYAEMVSVCLAVRDRVVRRTLVKGRTHSKSWPRQNRRRISAIERSKRNLDSFRET